MALTKLNEPELFCLAKNPAVFEFSTNNEYSTNGVSTIQDITFTSIPAPGNTIRLVWRDGDADLLLTFSGSPDDSGTELLIDSFATVAQYVEDVLVDQFKSVYLLNRDFEITYQSSGKVRFTSRESALFFGFTVSTVGSYGGSLTTVQGGIDPVRRDNFRIQGQLDLKYKTDSTYDRVEIELIPVGGKTIFDLSPILSSLDKLILTATARTTPLDISTQLIQYQASFAEAFGVTLTVQKLHIEEVKFAIYGGWNLRDRLAFIFNDDHLPDFLSNRSNSLLVENQPFFLYYIHAGATTTLVLRATLYYSDGSSESLNLYSISAGENSLWSLPCGWEILQTAADAGKTLTKASLTIANSASPTTALNSPYTLKLLQEATLDQFQLAFRNAYGVLETYVLKGSIVKTFTTTQQMAGLWTKYNTNINQPRFMVIGKEHVYGWQVASGNLSQEDSEALAELIASDRHYLISNGVYIPIALEASNSTIKETKSFSLNSYQLNFALLKDKNYSNVGNRIG